MRWLLPTNGAFGYHEENFWNGISSKWWIDSNDNSFGVLKRVDVYCIEYFKVFSSYREGKGDLNSVHILEDFVATRHKNRNVRISWNVFHFANYHLFFAYLCQNSSNHISSNLHLHLLNKSWRVSCMTSWQVDFNDVTQDRPSNVVNSKLFSFGRLLFTHVWGPKVATTAENSPFQFFNIFVVARYSMCPSFFPQVWSFPSENNSSWSRPINCEFSTLWSASKNVPEKNTTKSCSGR